VLALPVLARAKLRLATQPRSSALHGDGVLSLAGAVLAAATLFSLLVGSALGEWWADTGRDPSAGMPQVPPSPRARSAIPRIVRSNALPRVGEFDHPLDLRGCPFLVAQGSHEGAVAHAAIAALGGQPRVPCAGDPLRRAPPVLQLLSLS
jgi:hypothetical protein